MVKEMLSVSQCIASD